MEYKIVEEKDLERIKFLWAYCFESHQPFFDWYFQKYYQRQNTLGAYEEGELVANLQLIPYQIFLRGREIETSYFVGIATYPENRQSGHVGRLIAKSFSVLREKGHFVALLMPFYAGFYHDYDFQYCYHHLQYCLPLNELKNLVSFEGEFKLVHDFSASKNLESIYHSFVARRHAYVQRTASNWQLLLEEHFGEGGYLALLEKDGKPRGYLMYSLRQDKIEVKEIVYTDIKAYRMLLGYLYGHRSQVSEVVWNSPLDDNLYFLLPEQKRYARIFPFLMARIVDVQQCLAAINYPTDLSGNIILSIKDNLAKWNNEQWSLTISGGKGLVKIADEEQIDFELNIGVLTQLVFGRLSAQELYDLGMLEGISVEKLVFLEKVFPKCNNYINEYY